MAGHEQGMRAILAAFFANLGIAAAKFVGFVLTGSSSMLAESIHSVADTGNQGLLLLGRRRSRREPTADFPFGYGRERYFWSFVVALVLFSLGSLFAIYEGLHKLDHPEPLESPIAAYLILGVAIVLEAFSLRTAVHESREAKARRGWIPFIRTSKAPELPVVLLEDTGALLGLVVALGAVTGAEITGNPKWDGWGTIVIGGLLGIIAVFLATEMKGLLIGEAADPAVHAEIRTVIEADESVQRLIHCKTQHLGPEDVLLAAKIQFRPSLSGQDLADAVDAIEAKVRAAVPIAKLIYIEPDVHRSPGSG